MKDVGAYYTETAVSTQSKGRLVVMLYDGAVRYLNQAVKAIETSDFEKKGRLINRARDILFELNAVLDMEAGGQIAENLRKLYNFMWDYLAKANVKNDLQMVKDVIRILMELNSGFRAVAC